MSTQVALIEALRGIDRALPAIDDGDSRLNYGELLDQVEQEACWLQTLQVDRCALLADNSAAWVITDLALMQRRALHVPVPGHFTPRQVRHMLDDARIGWVITDRADEFIAAHPHFERVDSSPRTGLDLLRASPPAQRDDLQDIAKITYTSGSTGTAKGVCLSASSIEAVARSLAAATRGQGIKRHLCLLPLPTLLENIAGVYVPLLLGACAHVPALDAVGMSYAGVDAKRLLGSISATQPGSLVLVPELLRLLLHASRQGWTPPQSLKFIAVGGASVSRELLEQSRAAGLPVFEGYGLSECASVVCLNTPDHQRAGSVGRPLPHARVRIDSNGEICVRGATMHGYLGDGLCAAGEIRTGDLGEIDADGYVYVRGRLKNMFITSMGRNVTPEWVERELVSEPAIARALVSGEAKPYVVALIDTTAGSHDAVESALLRANSRLPDYARVRRWAFFPEPPSPANGLLTANGRLKRGSIHSLHGALLESLYRNESPSRRENFHELS